MNIKIITAPVKIPVSISEIKKQANIDFDDDDVKIEQLIKSVINYLDPPNGILGRAMITQTLQYSLAEFPSEDINLPYPPVQSLTTFTYLNTSGVLTTVPATYYVLRTDHDPGVIVLNDGYTWPTDISENDPLPVKITYVAGYGDDPEDIPEMVRLWIMMSVADLYQHREHSLIGQTITQNEFTRNLIDNYRWHHIESCEQED